MALEHYIQSGGRRLRCGYTTGTCAALAAQAAADMLLGQRPQTSATLHTPAGIPVTAELAEAWFTREKASCAVRKDAGDDFDSTDGMLVFADLTFTATPGVVVDGGEGVGRVTLPGLDQPVGAAAINRVPRAMIAREVAAVCERYGYTGGMLVVIRIPGGAEAAQKTFNPRLGIEGGLSVLGTSGIVEPQSLRALVDTIAVELRSLAARGCKEVIATPGNYGEAFLRERLTTALPEVKCSNFLGDTLDLAASLEFHRLYLIGHAGKLVKLAAGIMNTHSRFADGRAEVFAAHAALAGADRETVYRLMQAPTADACIAVLDESGLREPVLAGILDKLLFHARRRAGASLVVEAALFTNHYGLLCASSGAAAILTKETI